MASPASGLAPVAGRKDTKGLTVTSDCCDMAREHGVADAATKNAAVEVNVARCTETCSERLSGTRAVHEGGHKAFRGLTDWRLACYVFSASHCAYGNCPL